MANFRTHYDNLKIARNAPDSVIKAAYKALCQTYHPDKYQGSNKEAERIMKIINASYVVLIDPVQRALHDVLIKNKEASTTEQQPYQGQERREAPKTEDPPPSAKSNQQSYSTSTETGQERRRKIWEEWQKAEATEKQHQQKHDRREAPKTKDPPPSTNPNPHAESSQQEQTPTYSWLRRVVFVVCCIVALVIYATWKNYDRINGGGFVGGFLRGAIIFGLLTALWRWVKSGNKPKISTEPNQQNPELKSGNYSDSKEWLLWIGAIIVVIWLYSKSSNQITYPYSSSPAVINSTPSVGQATPSVTNSANDIAIRANDLLNQGRYAESLPLVLQLAEQNYVSWQLHLGYMYNQGLGVTQNNKLAFYWYKKAAEQGDSDGQYDLGYLYETGLGSVQDYSQATYWYMKAAEQGNTDAIVALKKLSKEKNEFPKAPVITQTNDSIGVEFDAEGVHKKAEIKGNRQIIGKQMEESKSSSPNSNYYDRLNNNSETKPKCVFKAAMSDEEIKNCQN